MSGEYYIAVVSDVDEYFMFLMDTGTFCHSWVLRRKRRPYVVSIVGWKMPSVKRRADATVAHLSLGRMEARVLQQWQESLERPSQHQGSCRLTERTPKDVGKSALDMISWRNAWDEYHAKISLEHDGSDRKSYGRLAERSGRFGMCV